MEFSQTLVRRSENWRGSCFLGIIIDVGEARNLNHCLLPIIRKVPWQLLMKRTCLSERQGVHSRCSMNPRQCFGIHFFQDGTSRDSGSCKMCPLHAKVCLWKRCLRKGVGQILIFLPPSKMLKHLPLKMCVSFVSKRQQSRNRKKKASQRRKLEKPMRHWCCQLRKEGRD